MSKKILWYFSDYNGTYDVIENDTKKIEKLFTLINEVRKEKNLDKSAFCFVSSNNCEFLRNVFMNLKNNIDNSKINIPDKDSMCLFSCLGANGYVIDPCNETSQLIKSRNFESKAERIYKIVCKANLPSEVIYADDCPAFNLDLLYHYMQTMPMKNLNNFTFLGSSNDEISEFPRSLNIIKNSSDDFATNGLENYLGLLHNGFNIEK